MANEIANCAILPLIEADGLNPTKAFNNELYLGQQEAGGVRLYYKDSNGVATVLNSGDVYLRNETLTAEVAMWNLFPVGYCQPFIPEIMGDLTTWLTNHPKWKILDNTVVGDIEGRVVGVKSSTANGKIGSSATSLPTHSHSINDSGHTHNTATSSHTHSINDPGHTHSYTATTPGGVEWGPGEAMYYNDARDGGQQQTGSKGTGISIYASEHSHSVDSSTTNISISASGIDASTSNYQPTYFVNWIVKYLV